MNGFRESYHMEKRTIFKLITTIAVFVSMGGCVKPKEQTKQAQTVVSSSTKEDKEAIKQKQIAYLKEHEQEIVDFVKSQNPKIESVQIDWTDVRWSDGGFLFPDYSIEVYGTVNHIEDSGWSASMPINDDDSIDLKKISIFNHITIGEEILE